MNREKNYINRDNKIELMNLLRSLWNQHVMWTRSFIVSSAANMPDLQLVTERLLRNPSDFAAVFKRFFGEKKSEKFKSLLTEHLTIAAQLIDDAKRGDTDAYDMTRNKWYYNADVISEFLACINPFWNEKAWQAALYSHLKMTEEEAIFRLNGQYASDIASFDSIKKQAMEMADMMSEGMIRYIYKN